MQVQASRHFGMKWACFCAGDGEVFKKCDESVLCVRVGECCFVMLCGGDGSKKERKRRL